MLLLLVSYYRGSPESETWLIQRLLFEIATQVFVESQTLPRLGRERELRL
jgi:uncharacterized membrane protein YbaN (DUF454 family)